MLELALHYEDGAMQLSEISRLEDISEKYLGQIVILLRSSGLIQSLRGAQGGYYLSKRPESINLFDIVSTLEGQVCVVECVEAEDCRRTKSCPSRKLWQMLENSIRETLTKVTLADMIQWYQNDEKNLDFNI